ncbi:MAG: c-type cytochrome domain-containing protein [Balneolaceae bacterium]|nr:c-type cytochrome domain-containing protein [Balneolaceae bacterium]
MNNNGDDGNGDTPPSTEPTFANVQVIFNNNCSGSGCHIGERESGVRLDGYNNVMESRGTQYQALIVQPNDADASPIVDKIEPNPDEGSRMPENSSPLSDNEISLIREWINEGAQNN